MYLYFVIVYCVYVVRTSMQSMVYYSALEAASLLLHRSNIRQPNEEPESESCFRMYAVCSSSCTTTASIYLPLCVILYFRLFFPNPLTIFYSLPPSFPSPVPLYRTLTLPELWHARQ